MIGARALPGPPATPALPALVLTGCALVHGILLLTMPNIVVIAVAMWWSANTVSHNFIHRPFFRTRLGNRIFSMYLSLLLGFPQTIWRERHLAHHADAAWKPRASRELAIELIALAGLWSVLAAAAPAFFLNVYLPGCALGLALCWIQGHYEHAHGTTSHYGRLYNTLMFNDGYHAEHHASPGVPWTGLPARRIAGARSSTWPPLLRWLDTQNPSNPSNLSNQLLVLLERLVLRSAPLQRFVLRGHRRAFAVLLPVIGRTRRVAIVGGGLFPRTALILRELMPDARLVIIDANSAHLEAARAMIGDAADFECRHYCPADEPFDTFDLVVIPLSFSGDRDAIYKRPPAHAVLVHDWIWQRRGTSAVVSPLLLKRVNLAVARQL